MKPHIATDQTHQAPLSHGIQQLVNSIKAVGQRLFNKKVAATLRGSERQRQVQACWSGDQGYVRRTSPRRFQTIHRFNFELGSCFVAAVRANVKCTDFSGVQLKQIPDVALSDGAATDNQEPARPCPGISRHSTSTRR